MKKFKNIDNENEKLNYSNYYSEFDFANEDRNYYNEDTSYEIPLYIKESVIESKYNDNYSNESYYIE